IPVIGIPVEGNLGPFFRRLHLLYVFVAVTLAECTIVEKVIAEIGVGHRRLGRRRFQSGMWIDRGNSGQPAAVRNTEDADPAIVPRDILDQPINGVVGVRALIDRLAGIRSAWRASHHEFTFGLETTANVLIHKNVAVRGEFATDAIGRYS